MITCIIAATKLKNSTDQVGLFTEICSDEPLNTAMAKILACINDILQPGKLGYYRDYCVLFTVPRIIKNIGLDDEEGYKMMVKCALKSKQAPEVHLTVSAKAHWFFWGCIYWYLCFRKKSEIALTMNVGGGGADANESESVTDNEEWGTTEEGQTAREKRSTKVRFCFMLFIDGDEMITSQDSERGWSQCQREESSTSHHWLVGEMVV